MEIFYSLSAQLNDAFINTYWGLYTVTWV